MMEKYFTCGPDDFEGLLIFERVTESHLVLGKDPKEILVSFLQRRIESQESIIIEKAKHPRGHIFSSKKVLFLFFYGIFQKGTTSLNSLKL